MKVNKIILIAILIFGSLCSATAQDFQIPYLKGNIKVDGKLDESVWNQVSTITNFYNHEPIDVGFATNQTEVKIFHNGEHIFVSAIYHDITSKRQVSSLKRDVPIGISDAFVMVFDTQNQEQNANLFAVNSYGTQVDALVERTETGYGLNFNWNAVWQVRTSLQGTNKVYEVAIPLKFLNYSKSDVTFGIQFYTRDIKNNSWTIMENVPRNYTTFDLRFTRKFQVTNLPVKASSRLAMTPAAIINYQNNIEESSKETDVKTSLDIQYNLTSSLKLDATLNPDFSQIDVDQQVTNLTRFSIFFPERRNFFLENADLFSSLGPDDVNPFYSRRVGANTNIQFGLKLSGNVTPKSRIGFLNVQTNSNEESASQNFGVMVAEQQLSSNFAATGFIVNRQETNKFRFTSDYNRVIGANLNYKSNNNLWTGLVNFGKSATNNISGDNQFINAGIWYNKRTLNWSASIKKVGENYITDVGFVPRLSNFDASIGQIVREGYGQTSTRLEYRKFYNQSKTVNWVRYFNYSNNNFYDAQWRLNQSSHFLNSAVFFKDLSAVYYVYTFDYIELQYAFDPLQNGNTLNPGAYRFGLLKLGYNSANNQRFRYRVNVKRGGFYSGKRSSAGLYMNYQLLPFANLELAYDINKLDLRELGQETFHLTRFTGEVFFSTRLNWTTYVQYNTQIDNFNINSRLQWEYKPLSYLFLVISDNFNQFLNRKNFGISFKMNYRLDL